MSCSCLDTNVFFHYADPDKCCYTQARLLIRSDDPLYTSYYVKDEVDKILRKRRRLNIEIQRHLHNYSDLSQFTPEIELRDSEKKYLEKLRSIDPEIMRKRLNFLMHKFDSDIRMAFSYMEGIIPTMHHDLLELELRRAIGNMNDVRILSDSVIWCERNKKSRCKFYTRDKKDFLDKRAEVEQIVKDFFMEDLLEISDLENFS